jgi:hypothetical protein
LGNFFLQSARQLFTVEKNGPKQQKLNWAIFSPDKKWPNFAGTLKNRSSTFIYVSEKLFDKIFR